MEWIRLCLVKTWSSRFVARNVQALLDGNALDAENIAWIARIVWAGQ